jgi:site-specific DNA-methyltransferase (adenine-specific)
MIERWRNQFYFGDNLDVLREHVRNESVDLIYLDPPFNSNATYNVLFRERSGGQVSLPQQAARTLGTVRYVNRLVSQCAQALAHGLQEVRKVVGGCRRQVIRRPSR